MGAIMIWLWERPFSRTKRRYAVGTLVCFCVLGRTPVGYGQTDRVGQLLRRDVLVVDADALIEADQMR